MKHTNVQDVQRAVSDYFGTSVADLAGLSRAVPLVRWRQLSFYLCRRHTSASYPEIGRAFGGRDHATVIHGVRAIERQLETDPALRETLAEIEGLPKLAASLRRLNTLEQRTKLAEDIRRRLEAQKESIHGLCSLWS